MKLIRALHSIRPHHQGAVLTIGNFDGVHLGHQTVLKHVLKKARQVATSAAVMVFEPQPLELFRPEQAPARLSQWREKYEQMQCLGLDYFVCARFNTEFAQQPAEYFIEQVLVKQLAIKALVVGDDFRFGRNRQGDYNLLKQAGEKFGFGVTSTESYRQSATRVSSTLVREALARGQFEEASRMLGRPFALSGRVVHGEKKGRQLGFPTANIQLKRLHSPLRGVFAVRVCLASQNKLGQQVPSQQIQSWQGIANIGTRPTLGGTKCQLEVHLFNFTGCLYGQRLWVCPEYRIRDEQKFNSLPELQARLVQDQQAGQAWFQTQT